jgi:hypothetical protein
MNAICIRWQTTDIEIMRLMTAAGTVSATTTPISSDRSSLTTTSTGLTETASQGSGSQSSVAAQAPPTGLNPGAITDIVIGSVGAIAVMLLSWVLLRLHRRRTADSTKRGTSTVAKHGEGSGKPGLRAPGAFMEVEDPPSVVEVVGDQRDHTWELNAK